MPGAVCEMVSKCQHLTGASLRRSCCRDGPSCLMRQWPAHPAGRTLSVASSRLTFASANEAVSQSNACMRVMPVSMELNDGHPPAGKAREEFVDAINRATFGKERIVLRRRGRAIAAVVPIDDLRLLEDLDDHLCDPRHSTPSCLEKRQSQRGFSLLSTGRPVHAIAPRPSVRPYRFSV